MFVIIDEHALGPVEVIRPFPHEEDARKYAETVIRIWRVTKLNPPKETT